MSGLEKYLLQILEEHSLNQDAVQLHYSEDAVILSGSVKSWNQVVDIGHRIAKYKGVKNLVNHITSDDMPAKKQRDIQKYYGLPIVDTADVVIIGAGVTGCAIARTLSKYPLDILVAEKEEDIACGTTKANNGMIHSGYDSKPESWKGKLNAKGNAMYTKWAEELHFNFMRTGSFVLAFNDEENKKLTELLENGKKNKVPGIALITGDEARKIEPGISDEAISALWTPSAGYVEPYEVTLALMENAIDNGARLRLDCEIVDIIKEQDFTLITTQGKIQCRFLINAAGLYADEIARMLNDEFFTIHPRRGTLVIFDKKNKGKIHTFSGQAPGNYTKGGGPQETPEGTLLWGPSAKEVPEKDNLEVDQDDLDFVIDKGMHLIKNVERSDVITYFSGNRAATYTEDFILQHSKKTDRLIYAAGIQSPGLASSPAIAEKIEELFLEKNPGLEIKADYNPIRKEKKPFRFCSMEERDALIKENPLYGTVICRCENITEGEIVDAIHGKIPARNIDAVKRRVRAGMGRCQGGFCQSRVLEILARELNKDETEITLKGKGSNILKEQTRQVNSNA